MSYAPDTGPHVLLISADEPAKVALDGTPTATYRTNGQPAVAIASPNASYEASSDLFAVTVPAAAFVSGVQQGWVTLRDDDGVVGKTAYAVSSAAAASGGGGAASGDALRPSDLRSAMLSPDGQLRAAAAAAPA